MLQILWMAEEIGKCAMFSVTNSGLSQVNPNFMVHRHLLLVVIVVSFGIAAP
jgi:hypothetical protein